MSFFLGAPEPAGGRLRMTARLVLAFSSIYHWSIHVRLDLQVLASMYIIYKCYIYIIVG